MKITDIKAALEKANGNPRFASFTYTAKKHGEKARYTLLLGANYSNICQDDITALEIELGNATGIRKVVIQGMIESLRESINAKAENRSHVNDTKAGLYETICPGLRININDGTCEILGLQVAKAVLVPGDYKEVKHRTEETAIKAEIRKTLKVGKIKTLCVDLGNFESARVNGETLELA